MVEFQDHYDNKCTIQASSLADYAQPGISAIWLGINDADPKVRAIDAARLGLRTNQTVGWVPYPIPPEVSLSTRMHLNREQVAGLIARLQEWLDSPVGEFK